MSTHGLKREKCIVKIFCGGMGTFYADMYLIDTISIFNTIIKHLMSFVSILGHRLFYMSVNSSLLSLSGTNTDQCEVESIHPYCVFSSTNAKRRRLVPVSTEH